MVFYKKEIGIKEEKKDQTREKGLVRTNDDIYICS